ncbi:hypothetical protein BDW75DRAFT_221914 [Aspergillus navahoensis]
MIVLESSIVTNTNFPLGLEKPRDSHELQMVQHRGYGCSSVWITRNSQNWLHLPPEYRPTCTAVTRSVGALVLGCGSGRVLIFGFSAEDWD